MKLRETFVWALCVLVSACATDPRLHANAIARSADLRHEQIAAGPFLLTTYVRISDVSRPLTVYIEGDGLAWRTRNQPSDDPTPRRPVGLSLAAADRSANVVYLARPCQYIPLSASSSCDVAYWTGKRFAPEVVAAMNDLVTHYMARTPGQRVDLVGYSGGGAIAVLLAARRQDVASLRTVAGNLDHDAVNRFHRVSLMPDSLNPADVVANVANIPQIHFTGSDDTIVPPAITRGFVTKVGACAQDKVIEGLSHEGAWDVLWPRLLASQPRCVPEETSR
ncbi:alpha/beta hydrolase [Uliginosibacterium sp. H3]|uniref:Alpha/beta hydrolase n=1 Tax=Uliginosibacterium silvisoli TaxID=3114758 RepID=A0ABU6K4L8_9RHOO|nr:alpha/beta hydrolase [Uliginosibacterium sp. H3]